MNNTVFQIAEAKKILADVRENLAKLDGCARHTFNMDGYRPFLTRRLGCIHCGGTMAPLDARHYLTGYVAAGGNPNDVWPGWKT